MRKLMALIAVVGFAGQAQADNHLAHSGSYRLIFTNNANADFDENSGVDSHAKAWNQRTRLGSTVKAGDNLSAHVNLVHNAQWGLNGLTDQYPTTFAGHNGLVVNEAYINWAINDMWSARFGRGSFTMADGSVVSANDWEAVSKAFEGALFSYDHEMARIGLFGVQGVSPDGTIVVPVNETAEFWGLNVDFKSLPDWLKMANLHYIMIKSNLASVAAEQNTTRLGLTVQGDTAGVDYRATYAMLGGETGATDTDVAATMMDAEVGYSMPNVRNLRVSAGYHTDSGDSDPAGGDSETYDPFHYDRHNNAGLMDVLGWGNLTYMRLGFTVDAADDIKVGANYYTFTATEAADDTYDNDFTGLGVGGTEDDIGSELDVWATKAYGSNFSINARYGMFSPGDRLGAGLDDNTLMYLEGLLTF
jgi:hypothetical protein